MKTQSESSLLSFIRSSRGEKILEVDGTVTTQPVLEHIGISAWPGKLMGHIIDFKIPLLKDGHYISTVFMVFTAGNQ